MNKPITIRQLGNGSFEVTCDHRRFRGSRVVETYDAAEGMAHMWGRYKCGLGDFLFAYVNGLRGEA